MSLQGSLVVIAEESASELVEALSKAGAFPIVETRWSDAPAAFVSVEPSAIIIAEPGPATDQEAAKTLDLQIKTRNGPLVPLIGRARVGAPRAMPDGLPIDADAACGRLVARLHSALRVRALHAAVLRRAETLADETGRVAKLPEGDPLDDATVLVAGRGGSYPSLAVAIGERVGLVGALSIETAAKYLNAREIHGMIIGEGFSTQMVVGLLTVLTEDARFRDMPIAVLGNNGHLAPFHAVLANLERIDGKPAQVLDWMLPLVRLRAFEARLKRALQALDGKGMIEAETGLLCRDAFWRELARAVEEAERHGTGLCIARFAFDGATGRRASLDAARLIGRVVRNIDFAQRQEDGSVIVVFTQTELRAAHIIARRIAAMLKSTMVVGERAAARPEPSVTLATLKSRDTVETLVERVGTRAVAVLSATA